MIHKIKYCLDCGMPSCVSILDTKDCRGLDMGWGLEESMEYNRKRMLDDFAAINIMQWHFRPHGRHPMKQRFYSSSNDYVCQRREFEPSWDAIRLRKLAVTALALEGVDDGMVKHAWSQLIVGEQDQRVALMEIIEAVVGLENMPDEEDLFHANQS